MGAKKISDEMLDRVHDYLGQWIREDEWCDLSVMLDQGDTEMAAAYMLGTGAIDSESCYPEAKELEQAVETLGLRFQKQSRKLINARYTEVFKDCFISSCEDCGHVSFVSSGNEDLYPELKTNCWDCTSKNIKTKRGL